MASRVNIISLWAIWISIIPQVLAACYFPNGLLAPNDTPCRDDTENSVCCGQGYACLSNGICQATGSELQKPGATEFVRGGCTDKEWRSSSCPLFCIDPRADNTGGGMGLSKCEDTKRDLYVCINVNYESTSCEDGIGLLFFAGTPVAITTIGVTPITSSSTSSTPTPEVVSTTKEPRETTTQPAPATTSPSLPATPSPANDENTLEGTESHALPTGVIAGIAIGAVFILVFCALAWWFIRRRKRSQAVDAPDQRQPPSDAGMAYYEGNDGKPWAGQTIGELEGSSHRNNPLYEFSGIVAPQELPTQYNDRQYK